MLNLTSLLFTGLVLTGISDLREPDLSPDCGTVVFCFRGDIWEASVQGGPMRNMVPGSSIETSPHYSPDGRMLAFTGDRVGYLHIPSMSNSSVDQFLVDLFAQGLNRDGMVIDIRSNGGGNTHDDILRRLERPMYMFSMNRYGSVTFQPLGVWQKPLVLLINERCYSDGEIFPAAWKELEMGPVVGERTFGAVIGTSDVYLVDGTRFRIPSTGWYTLTGENLENNGVRPDVRVREMPADAGKNVDRQLDTAAEIIMEML